MTTEIAVINRLGVAIAADSAVTLSGPGLTQKVFNTGDKLFELRHHQSIAVMVYGNLHYLGVPWEIIIKDFRKHDIVEEPLTMKDWACKFVEFIEGHRSSNSEQEIDFVIKHAHSLMQLLHKRVGSAVQRMVQEGKSVEPHDLSRLFDIHIKFLTEEILAKDEIPSLANITPVNISRKYNSILSKVVTSAFVSDDGSNEAPVFTAAHSKQVINLIKLSLKRGISQVTGIVICGFAGDDLFPSLHSIELSGTLCGRLRYHEIHDVEISVKGHKDKDFNLHNLGTAISFAQTHVTDRLLRGYDDRVLHSGSEFIGSIADVLRNVVQSTGLTISAPDGSPYPFPYDKFSDLVRDSLSQEFEKLIQSTGRAIEADFHNTIALMPKQELVELAEALVGITAVERKATKDAGTVGGPIDVALITRSEGFVWIKRKHHFSPDLNPRYLSRVRAPYGEGDAQ